MRTSRTWSRSRRWACSRPSTATIPPAAFRFEPYAIPTIVGEIKRHFRDHTWDIHVPRRFFHDMTQSRIGEELGISQMHVSRLLRHACEQVRQQVEDDGVTDPDRIPEAVAV